MGGCEEEGEIVPRRIRLVGIKPCVGRKGANHKDRIITKEEAGDVCRSSIGHGQEFRLYSNSNVNH